MIDKKATLPLCHCVGWWQTRPGTILRWKRCEELFEDISCRKRFPTSPYHSFLTPFLLDVTSYIASKLLNDNGAKSQALSSLSAAWDTPNNASVAGTCDQVAMSD